MLADPRPQLLHVGALVDVRSNLDRHLQFTFGGFKLPSRVVRCGEMETKVRIGWRTFDGPS